MTHASAKPPWGLAAEFAGADALLAAARAARAAGYRHAEAYAPFAVEGLPQALGLRSRGIAPACLLGGVVGGLGGFFMQWYAIAVSYPIDIGGRPALQLADVRAGELLAGGAVRRLCRGRRDAVARRHAAAVPPDLQHAGLRPGHAQSLLPRASKRRSGIQRADGPRAAGAARANPHLRDPAMTARPIFMLMVVWLSTGLVGCDRSRFDMLAQPKLGPDAASVLFEDRKATRPPPTGTVAHAMGEAAMVSSGRNGTEALRARDAAEAQRSLPERPPRALLLRGQERYAIYCMPCHSPVGDGDGPVVRRGFPAPPSFHDDRLRTASDRHIYDVITQGFGVMYPFADRIEPADRWAIVAFVRALQLSRHAPASEVAQAAQRPAVADASGAWHVVPPAAELRR